MITLHKEEPGWLGRPVARAAGDGRPARVGLGTLRFGLGCGTTEAEIRDVAQCLIRVAETVPAVLAPIA